MLCMSNLRHDSTDGYLDLYEAAAKGKIQIIESTPIPDLDATNTKSETLLYLAAANGHSKIVRFLLEKGAEPKIRNSKGQTALMSAARGGHVDVMEILCDGSYDAGVNLDDYDGRTALRHASHYEPWKFLLSLGSKIDIEHVDCAGNTPLHVIVWKDHEFYKHEPKFQKEIVTSLLDRGVDINRRNWSGKTPLMEASIQNNYEVVSILLNPKYKADLNAKSDTGKTALILAVESKSWNTVKLLLDFGADIKCYDLRGFSALHTAVHISESAQFAEILMHMEDKQQMKLKKGDCAEIYDIVDRRLMEAENMVKMLTKNRDFNFRIRDFRGQSVTDLQIHSSVIKSRIQDKSGDIDDGDILKKAIHSLRDDRGNTILHRLALNDWHPILKQGITSADFYLREIVNLTNDKGRTALHGRAMRIADAFVCSYIKLFLKLGADRNIQDIYGRIPAEYASGELFSDGDENKDSVNLKQTPLLLTRGNCCWISPTSGSELLKRLFEAKKARLLLTIKGKNLLKVLNVQRYQPNYAYNIWRYGEFAYRKPESLTICEEVTRFVQNLLQFVSEREPLFKSRLQMVGSAREKTKIDKPDEFDFSAILDKLGEVCQVVEPADAAGVPKGYIHLKRSRDKSLDNLPRESLDNFFSEDGFLLTDEVNSKFQICIERVLNDKKFWKNEQHFDNQFYYTRTPEEILWRAPLVCETFKVFYVNKRIGGQHVFKKISIDVVPCIHIDNWWPKEAIPCRNSEEIRIGCNFVFDQPQRKYLGVPYSAPYAKISFAPLESKIIADSPTVVRAVYMVAKHILDAPKHSNILKTCLLYCLEAFPEKIKSCSDEVTETDLNFWVRKLFKCFLLFCLQDFVPCYFMPEFHVVFSGHKKPNRELLKILGVKRGNGLEVLSRVMESLRSTKGHEGFCPKICNAIEEIATAYRVYWSVCDDETEVEFSLPDPDGNEDKYFLRSELFLKIRSSFVKITQKP